MKIGFTMKSMEVLLQRGTDLLRPAGAGLRRSRRRKKGEGWLLVAGDCCLVGDS